MKDIKALMLQKPSLTVAAAESLTCGRVQAELGAVSGASDYFLGGITAYSTAQKVAHLRVDRAVAEPVKSVSAEVAEQMARGVCVLFGSDLGLATTGYAEPSKADHVDMPFAYWAIAHRDRSGRFIRVFSGRVECPGASRTDAQLIVAKAVVGELAEYLTAFRAAK